MSGRLWLNAGKQSEWRAEGAEGIGPDAISELLSWFKISS